MLNGFVYIIIVYKEDIHTRWSYQKFNYCTHEIYLTWLKRKYEDGYQHPTGKNRNR